MTYIVLKAPLNSNQPTNPAMVLFYLIVFYYRVRIYYVVAKWLN